MENQANAQKLGADAQGKSVDAQAKMVEAQMTLPDQVEKIKAEAALKRAQWSKAQLEAQALALDTQMEVDGTKHRRDVEKMQAQARGNQDLEIMKALGKPQKEGEGSPDIEAMVGFSLTADKLKEARLNNSNGVL